MFVNTGQEFDGSDSGASPDEAVSWGKIRTDAQPVKVLYSLCILCVATIFLNKWHKKKDLSCVPHFGLKVASSAQSVIKACWLIVRLNGVQFSERVPRYSEVKHSFVLCVQVCADASLVFPLMVAETFALQVDKLSPGKKAE